MRYGLLASYLLCSSGQLKSGYSGLFGLCFAKNVGAAIMPGCFGNRGLLCRGTKSSNPSPSSGESANRQSLSGGRWLNPPSTKSPAITCSRRCARLAKELDLKSPFETNQPVSLAYMNGIKEPAPARPVRQDQPRRHSGACLCPVHHLAGGRRTQV
jgi:hypothetical protein